MGIPQRPITSLHPNPPAIGKSRFSTEIKLAQGRGRGGRMSTEGGRGGREGGGGKKHIRILVQICIKSAFQWRILMGSPQRPITSLHPNPP